MTIFKTSNNFPFRVHREHGDTFFSILSQGSWKKISDVAAPQIPYQTLNMPDLEHILSNIQSRIVLLSDKTWKLYLQPRLLGGMLAEDDKALALQLGIFDRTISDKELAKKIIAGLPSEVYSSVTVTTLRNYSFYEEKKDARIITLDHSCWQWVVNFVRVIFTEPREVIPTGNEVISAILGSQQLDDIKALTTSFRSNQHIILAIAFDQSYVTVQLHSSSATEATAAGSASVRRAYNQMCTIS